MSMGTISASYMREWFRVWIGMDCPALRLTQIGVSHPKLDSTYIYVYL